MPDQITTFSGVAAAVLLFVLRDMILKRLADPREKGKADNLSEQTVLLREIVKQKKKRVGSRAPIINAATSC